MGTDCIDSCKSNYHTIMTSTAPGIVGTKIFDLPENCVESWVGTKILIFSSGSHVFRGINLAVVSTIFLLDFGTALTLFLYFLIFYFNLFLFKLFNLLMRYQSSREKNNCKRASLILILQKKEFDLASLERECLENF